MNTFEEQSRPIPSALNSSAFNPLLSDLARANTLTPPTKMKK